MIGILVGSLAAGILASWAKAGFVGFWKMIPKREIREYEAIPRPYGYARAYPNTTSYLVVMFPFNLVVVLYEWIWGKLAFAIPDRFISPWLEYKYHTMARMENMEKEIERLKKDRSYWANKFAKIVEAP